MSHWVNRRIAGRATISPRFIDRHTETTMQFLDDSLLPENQQPLVIQVAPYGPEWIPADSSDIPVTMDEQVQKAVDCYNAGATLLHVHVREADGKGSKRLSMFNETACPPARCGSRHDPAGRRLDLIRARDRQRGGPMAQRRHAPHAGRAHAEARPGDDRDQHQPDEHLRAADRRRRRGHLAGEAGLSGGLPRDDHSLGARPSSRSTCAGCRPTASSRTSCSATWASSSPSSA